MTCKERGTGGLFKFSVALVKIDGQGAIFGTSYGDVRFAIFVEVGNFNACRSFSSSKNQFFASILFFLRKSAAR